MPKGPKGEKRPGDVIGAAIMVARIATGEISNNSKSGRVKSGHAGSKARTEKLTPAERSEIAKRAASIRWRS